MNSRNDASIFSPMFQLVFLFFFDFLIGRNWIEIQVDEIDEIVIHLVHNLNFELKKNLLIDLNWIKCYDIWLFNGNDLFDYDYNIKINWNVKRFDYWDARLRFVRFRWPAVFVRFSYGFHSWITFPSFHFEFHTQTHKKSGPTSPKIHQKHINKYFPIFFSFEKNIFIHLNKSKNINNQVLFIKSYYFFIIMYYDYLFNYIIIDYLLN